MLRKVYVIILIFSVVVLTEKKYRGLIAASLMNDSKANIAVKK
jgi:hypothetical protein